FRRVLFRSKRGMLVKFEGLDDRTAVEPLAGRYILMPLEKLAPLEEGEVYYHQLLGAEVVTVEGQVVGRVREVFETEPAHLLEVQGDEKVHLIPFTERIVKEVDVERKRLVIEPPAGRMESGRPAGPRRRACRRERGGADQHRHHIPAVLHRAAVVEHSGPGGRSGAGDVPGGGLAGLHARPAPDGGRRAVRGRVRDGDEAGAVLRGGGRVEAGGSDRAAVRARQALRARGCGAALGPARDHAAVRPLQGRGRARGGASGDRGDLHRGLRAQWG